MGNTVRSSFRSLVCARPCGARAAPSARVRAVSVVLAITESLSWLRLPHRHPAAKPVVNLGFPHGFFRCSPITGLDSRTDRFAQCAATLFLWTEAIVSVAGSWRGDYQMQSERLLDLGPMEFCARMWPRRPR